MSRETNKLNQYIKVKITFPQDKNVLQYFEKTQFSYMLLIPFQTAAHHKTSSQGYNETAMFCLTQY